MLQHENMSISRLVNGNHAEPFPDKENPTEPLSDMLITGPVWQAPHRSITRLPYASLTCLIARVSITVEHLVQLKGRRRNSVYHDA